VDPGGCDGGRLRKGVGGFMFREGAGGVDGFLQKRGEEPFVA